ncbi:MAG: hypothetical protein D6786_04505, partial [Gammaproteobacteria bacterium]
MKVRRFFARDMREGLRMVREAQGPDVLILSNRKVPGGVELVTAEDYDEKLLRSSTAPREPSAPKRTPADLKAALEAARKGRPPQPPGEDRPAPASGPHPDTPASRPGVTAPRAPAAETSAAQAQVLWTDEGMLERMQEEIQTLRGLLEQQLSGLAWGELGRRTPVAAALLHGLSALG